MNMINSWLTCTVHVCIQYRDVHVWLQECSAALWHWIRILHNTITCSDLIGAALLARLGCSYTSRV